MRGALRIRIVTLFPPLFESWLKQGVVARAMGRGLLSVELINLRDFGIGRHQVTDDYPFGGGPGMVLKCEPVFAALDSLEIDDGEPVILLSPQGEKFDQRMAEELAGRKSFVLLAGHYEGVDERIKQHAVTREVSIGDYVLSAGELAAMVVADAASRLVPGALADGSTVEESFAQGLLEYPHYTRPATFRDWQVPDVLLSGNHGEIEKWRRSQALRMTLEKRPDLFERANVTPGERKIAAVEPDPTDPKIS